MRHPYNGTPARRLGAQYEIRGKLRVLMWLCPASGDVIGEEYWERKDSE